MRRGTDSPRSLPTELERQAGKDKGREKERQEPLAGASEGDQFALGRIEGLNTARVSAIADLEGVTSRFDGRFDRVVHFNRPDTLTVDEDVERATTDLRSDCLVRELESCRHQEPPLQQATAARRARQARTMRTSDNSVMRRRSAERGRVWRSSNDT